MRPFSASSPLLPVAAAVIILAGLWTAGRRMVAPDGPTPLAPTVSAVPAPSAPIPLDGAGAELARLREENARLQAQLNAARGSLDQAKENLTQTAKELEQLRRPLEVDMASATLRASLAPGEGVVTGGYRLPDGSRLFAFVETDALPSGEIGVTSRFFAVPDDLTQTLGLQTLSTEAANTLQHGEVWVRDELTEIADRLEQTPTARILTGGATSLSPGHRGEVPLPTNPGDPPLSLSVNAVYDADRNLDFELRVESVPTPAASSGAPATVPAP